MAWKERINLHRNSNRGATKPMRCRPCETLFWASQGPLCPFMPNITSISNYEQHPFLVLPSIIYAA